MTFFVVVVVVRVLILSVVIFVQSHFLTGMQTLQQKSKHFFFVNPINPFFHYSPLMSRFCLWVFWYRLQKRHIIMHTVLTR